MAEELVQEVSVEHGAVERSTKELLLCPKCEVGKLQRVFREGFLQEIIYPRFGYFPWRCLTCGHLEILHKRHRKRFHVGGSGHSSKR
jgi:hypothetical protein